MLLGIAALKNFEIEALVAGFVRVLKDATPAKNPIEVP
jgi:hypothetical protein